LRGGIKMGKLLNIPGPKAKAWIRKFKKYSVTSTNDSPLVIERADEDLVYLWTVDNQRVLDFTSGVGVSNTGFGYPQVAEAMIEQIKTGLWQFIFYDYITPRPTELLEKLAKIAPGDILWKVFLCNSGTEANEAAVKLLFAARPERKRIIAFTNAFHGRTGYSLPLMGSKSIHKKYFPEAYVVHRFPYPSCYQCGYDKEPKNCDQYCVKAIEREFGRTIPPEEVNAVFIEFVQGEGGINVPNKKAIEKLVELCKKYDILIVDDEVQAGFGRTGRMWACEHFGVVPDIITLAKCLTSGGAPGGAMIVRDGLDFEAGQHSNTNGGNIISAVAALASIEVIKKEKLVANAKLMGDFLKTGLVGLQRKYRDFIGDVRGLGLMQGIEIVKDRMTKRPNPKLRDEIIKQALIRGLNLIGSGNALINPTIRFLPPLVINKEQIDEAIEILDEAIEVAIKRLSK